MFSHYCFLSIRYSRFIFLKNSKLPKSKSEPALSTLTDTVFGLTVLDHQRPKRRFIKQFAKDSKENNKIDKTIQSWNQSRTFQLQNHFWDYSIFIGIWAGNQAHAGVIAPAYIAAFTLVTIPIVESLIPVSHAVERITTYHESLQRLDNISQFVHKSLQLDNVTRISNQRQIYTIQDAYYRYEHGQKDALQQISLSIPQGKKIAVLEKAAPVNQH